VRLLPGACTCVDDAVGDHVHRLLERELLPVGAVRPPVLDLVLAHRARDVPARCGALRAETTARDRAVRIALDLDDLTALDVHARAAADGAVGTDRAHDRVCVVDARPQRGAALRADRLATPQGVTLGQLAHERPGAEPRGDAHRPAPTILIDRA